MVVMNEKKEKEEKKEIVEECVICHEKTEYLKSTPIQERKYYVSGVGQFCENCGKRFVVDF